MFGVQSLVTLPLKKKKKKKKPIFARHLYFREFTMALRAMLVFFIVSQLIWLHMLTIFVLLVVLKVLK